jgi:hypothetical protein
MAAPVARAKASTTAAKQTGLKPYAQELAQAAWETANGNCRGGSGDDTYMWCNIRALLQHQVLTPNNRCFDGETTASSTWRSCSADYRRLNLADNWYEEGGPLPTATSLTRAYLSNRAHLNSPPHVVQFQQRNCTRADGAYWTAGAFLDGHVYGMEDSTEFGIILPWTERFFVVAYWNDPEEAENGADRVGFSLAERCS